MLKNVNDFIVVQDGEEWKPVVGCEEYYSVSSHGRIFSWKSRYKYTYIPRGLRKENKENKYVSTLIDYGPNKRIHRIVAEAFIPNPDNLPHVHHIDHNKSNNRVDNLMWVTPAQNLQYAREANRWPVMRGEASKRYGSTHTLETKAVMSEKKLGEKHPKFKGWYVINGVVYPSANQAGKALGIHPIYVTRNIAKGIPGWEFKPKD